MKYIKESEDEKILISDYLKELELKTKTYKGCDDYGK